MTQPMDRSCMLPQLGEMDEAHGEFWVENPFLLPQLGKNISAYEKNQLFLNVPGEAFLNASFASQADIDSDSRSVVAADFDRDGYCDLLVGSDGGGPLRMFRNSYPWQTHRVRLRLVGQRSNRPAIGSRVVLQCGGRQIVRDLFAVNGFLGQAPADMLIGVGTSERIEQLTIRWPTGQEQSFTDLGVDREIVLTEGHSERIPLNFLADRDI